MTRRSFGVFFFLHLCIALFFIVLGMEGFFFRNSSDVAMVAGKLAGIFGGESVIYLILISILEIVCGVVMLVSLVSPVGAGFLRISILVSMLLWLTVIILKDVIGASVLTDFPVGVLRWLRPLILDVVLLLSMWTVRIRD